MLIDNANIGLFLVAVGKARRLEVEANKTNQCLFTLGCCVKLKSMNKDVTNKRRHALLVGVNQYDFLGELSFARQDAESFSSMLVSKCGFSAGGIQVMTCSSKGGMRAQGRYIEEMISGLADIDDLGLLIIGFWGHGFTTNNGALFLCGYDAREDQLEKTAVSMDFVRTKISQAGAEQTLMVLDCCQSRAAGRGSQNRLSEKAETEIGRFARLVQVDGDELTIDRPRSTAVITSCRPGESAYEWQDREHGIFTAHLLDALASGHSTAATISSYLARNVPRTAMELYRQPQTPWLEHRGSSEVELYSVSSLESQESAGASDAIAKAAKQESSLMRFSSAIREYLFEFRQSRPCKISDLREQLSVDFPVEAHSERTLLRFLEDGKEKGLLNGYYFNERVAFLALHLVEAKLDINQEKKCAIGQRAALYVFDGMCVGIDGGTTTLEVARELARMMKARALRGIHIVTNSMIAAQEISKALTGMDVGDDTSICKVTIVGRWCRPGSMTTVYDSDEELEAAVSLGLIPKKIDISFVGAPGIIEDRGFANGSKFELPCKKYFLNYSENTYVLMEARKLAIELPHLITEFGSNVNLITEKTAGMAGRAQKVLEALLASGAEVIVAD